MSKARLVLMALFVEHRSAVEVAERYEVHRGWVYKLKARYEAEGESAFALRSRRPKTSPRATPAATVDLVIGLRKELAGAGLDAGADTIGWHLDHRHGMRLSRATIHRILVRSGAVTRRRRNDLDRPTCGSRRTSRTSVGRPTSPTTDSPTAAAVRVAMWRSCPGSTTTPATPSQ